MKLRHLRRKLKPGNKKWKSFGDFMKGLVERHNHRLKNFDYGSYNYYYVTICTKNKQKLLSSITVESDALVVPDTFLNPDDIKNEPTKLGEKIIECWNNIEKLNENIKVDKFVIMPNHIHGIIIIENKESIDPIEKQYSFQIAERRGRRSLQGLIKDFKSVTTRYYKKAHGVSESLWQESFYDSVITSQQQYENICNYINLNPINWVLKKDTDDF